MNSNSFMQVQVRVQKKYFFKFKFEFGKMIEFFRVHSPGYYQGHILQRFKVFSAHPAISQAHALITFIITKVFVFSLL